MNQKLVKENRSGTYPDIDLEIPDAAEKVVCVYIPLDFVNLNLLMGLKNS